jgi:hypothetical protein
VLLDCRRGFVEAASILTIAEIEQLYCVAREQPFATLSVCSALSCFGDEEHGSFTAIAPCNLPLEVSCALTGHDDIWSQWGAYNNLHVFLERPTGPSAQRRAKAVLSAALRRAAMAAAPSGFSPSQP